MSGKAAKIMITELQLSILQRIANAVTSTVQHGKRARIIIKAFQGQLNGDIAAEVGLNRLQVGMWRRRWTDSFNAMVDRDRLFE